MSMKNRTGTGAGTEPGRGSKNGAGARVRTGLWCFRDKAGMDYRLHLNTFRVIADGLVQRESNKLSRRRLNLSSKGQVQFRAERRLIITPTFTLTERWIWGHGVNRQ